MWNTVNYNRWQRARQMKARRWARCWCICVFYFFIGVLFILILLFAALQTPGIQRYTLKKCDLVQHDENQGMPMQYNRISGVFPISFRMHNVSFVDPVGRRLDADYAHIQFNPLSLFRRKIRLSSMYINYAVMSNKAKKLEPLPPPQPQHPGKPTPRPKERIDPEELAQRQPWPNVIFAIHVDEMIWGELVMKEYNMTIHIKAYIVLEHSGGDMHAYGTFHNVHSPKTNMNVSLFGNHSERKLHFSGRGAEVHADMPPDNMTHCVVQRLQFRSNATWREWQLLTFPVDNKRLRNNSVTAWVRATDVSCGSPELRRTDYAAYMPHTMETQVSLDPHANVNINNLAVHGRGYSLTGNGFFSTPKSFRVMLEAQTPLLDYMRIFANDKGGNFYAYHHYIPFVERHSPRGSDERTLVMSSNFKFPNATGVCRIYDTVIYLGRDTELRGHFDISAPMVTRQRGAPRDVVEVNGGLRTIRGPLSMSVKMELDTNFEQQMHISAEGKDIVYNLSNTHIGNMTTYAWISRFPFDPHGLIQSFIYGFTSPTLTVDSMTFVAMRDSFVSNNAKTLLDDHVDEKSEARPWRVRGEANGGDIGTCESSAEVHVTAKEGMIAQVLPSFMLYRNVTAWTNQTSRVELKWENWRHEAHSTIHTQNADSNNVGTLYVNLAGNENITAISSTFQHSLDSITKLAHLVLSQTQAALGGENHILADPTKAFSGTINGAVLVYAGTQTTRMQWGHVQIIDGAYHTHVYESPSGELTHKRTLVHSVNCVVDGSDGLWRVSECQAESPPHGRIQAKGFVWTPHIDPYSNRTLLPVSVEVQVETLHSIYDASVSMNGTFDIGSGTKII